MPTPGERQALGFLVFIALSGASVRLWRANRPIEVPSVAALDRQLVRVDSAQRAPKRSRKAPPKRDTVPAVAGPVDLDRASAAEIDALPGIGPALAARIVAHRDSAGSFGSMDAFCEVRGIGPALAKRLSPLVTFTAGFRPVSTACDRASKPPKKSSRQRTGK
jgi:competence protein ComEA